MLYFCIIYSLRTLSIFTVAVVSIGGVDLSSQDLQRIDNGEWLTCKVPYNKNTTILRHAHNHIANDFCTEVHCDILHTVWHKNLMAIKFYS